ncbi:MAG: 4-alpha-glucanotransferase [Treponema sp.]|nr:4-alpha-glucanotransferase [Treponema sp.]
MNKRKSGILLHVTSLPGTPGIGTLGECAYKFADWLKESNQSYWQVLPLGPTGYGDSPYQSFSTFAGNPLLIDFDDLVKRGWACKEDVLPPEYIKSQGNVDFGSVVWWKMPVLAKCASYFLKKCSNEDRASYEAFKNDQSSWLNNYADYTSIKNFYDQKAKNEGVEGVASMWNRWWPRELAEHNPTAVSRWDAEHTDDIEQIKVIQFFFATQWSSLKKYVNSLGIKIIGDIPIFVAGDSADVWANQKFFQMDPETLLQKTCAGVPPDYFSATGQLWGNPLYDWDAIKKDNYSWWVDRIKNMLRLVDVIRIDHFRGFESYWQIPYGAPNAIKGEWIKGPGKDLFDEIKKRLGSLPIIAEDLGVITPEVEELRDGCAFPGMKILQFAFNDEPWSEESAENKDLPGNYTTSNIIVYTGTHDNDTSAGFFASASEQLKKNVAGYFELEENLSPLELTSVLIERAYQSKADTAVIPLQDVFALGSEARMNTPSTTGSNWTWRMEKEMLSDTKRASYLKELSQRFNRNC